MSIWNIMKYVKTMVKDYATADVVVKTVNLMQLE